MLNEVRLGIIMWVVSFFHQSSYVGTKPHYWKIHTAKRPVLDLSFILVNVIGRLVVSLCSFSQIKQRCCVILMIHFLQKPTQMHMQEGEGKRKTKPNEAFHLADVYLAGSDAMKCNDWTGNAQDDQPPSHSPDHTGFALITPQSGRYQ